MMILKKLTIWLFNGKQAQEVIFNHNIENKYTHPPLIFSNTTVSQTNLQKLLVVYIRLQINF